jgi:foldase protein PrsA
MRTMGKIKILTLALLMMSILPACRVKEGQYEVTNYIGSSISNFEKKTDIDLLEQSKDLYIAEGKIQVIAPGGDVSSVTLLDEAKEYTIYGVAIGMKKSDAEKLLNDTFGKELNKTIDSANHSITYHYMNKEHELYVSFDIDREKVTELSFYKAHPSDSEEETQDTARGELMAMIGDSKVYYNEAMVYLKSVQENYEKEYGKDIWEVDIQNDGNSFGDLIKDVVIDQIIELKIIVDKAKELGIELDSDEKADARAFAREHYEGLSDQDIIKYHMTKELLENVYANNILAEKVFETVTINVDNTVPDHEAQQITVQHILIKGTKTNDEGKEVALSQEEKQVKYEKVQSLLSKAKETEDFYALAEANTEADIIEYTFGRGTGPTEYSSAFEQAAFTLKTGEVSNIISTEYGWHIIYCVTDFNEDATTQVKENIIEQRRMDMFANVFSEWSTNYDVVINTEAWKSISFE